MTDSRNTFRRLRAAAPTVAALAATVLAGACGGDSVSGPQVTSCGPPPYFTVLPVPSANLKTVSVVGGVDAPGHTLPTDHGGIFVDGPNVPLRAPGDLVITRIGRGSYSGEGVPPGTQDYALYFQVCQELTGWFGHVPVLSSQFDDVEFGDCRTYSTPFVTIESCTANDVNIRVSAGVELGRVNGGLDMGMADQRASNFYVSPQRFPGFEHAVCMWDQFDAANREILYSKLRDARRPHIVPAGEPRCGTMAVDVAGTAKGIWAETSVTGQVGPDDRGFIALVDYPYRPQDDLALSLGPDALGAHIAFVDRQTSGRVNRAFEHVTPDGQIYCYGPEVEYSSVSSWLLTLISATELRIERIQHGAGPSPCEDDPATWSFGGTAVTMVR